MFRSLSLFFIVSKVPKINSMILPNNLSKHWEFLILYFVEEVILGDFEVADFIKEFLNMMILHIVERECYFYRYYFTLYYNYSIVTNNSLLCLGYFLNY